VLNANELNGKIDEAKGRVKAAVGVLTGDKDLEAQGKADETVGKVEVAVGGVVRAAADAVTHIVTSIKR
jgi:uncharacterized protein YjbJ (UPF0337 family)